MYNIGDKVKIRRDLVINETYDGWLWIEQIQEDAEHNNYVFTISNVIKKYDRYTYWYEEDTRNPRHWELTDEMIEGLATDTDEEKFKAWMTKLAEINCNDYENVWKAFDRIKYYYTEESHKDGENTLDNDIEILWNYLNVPVKEMTLSEIEAELGYKIKIKE